MLVVVSIMMMLVAMAASVFRPANDSRRIRETARSINVYLSSARNRAMETGRPCGVVLRQFSGQPFALTLEQCEVPPSYAGDAENSRAYVWITSISATTAEVAAFFDPIGSFTSSLVSVGDLVQFNNQGPVFTITQVDPNYIVAQLNISSGQLLPWPHYPQPWQSSHTYVVDDIVSYNYQLYKSLLDDNTGKTPNTNPTYWTPITLASSLQPVLCRVSRSPTNGNSIIKNAAQSLQLPAATVVDPQFSGCGNGQFIPTWNNTAAYNQEDRVISLNNLLYRCLQTNTNKQPEANPSEWQQILFPDITILFAPNGAVQSIYVPGVAGSPFSVTDPIFLLVGKRERIPFDPTQYDVNNPDTFANWQDLSNLWVVINPQTGLVTTGEMAAVASGGTYNDARVLARDMQGMGGK